MKCFKCGKIGHPSFFWKRVEKTEDKRTEEDKQQEHVVYYCPEQDKEKWEIIEAIVDTGCEATIIGEL